MRFCSLLWVIATMLVAAGGLAESASAEKSLYNRLGGESFVNCWIDRSLAIIARDPRIDDFFAGELRTAGLRAGLIAFACDATGGGCAYDGPSMACAHAGLGIGHGDFDAFMTDLELGARRCHRNEPAYSEFAKVLRSLRPVVVQDDPDENPSCGQ